jgi:replicative DNA helicase
VAAQPDTSAPSPTARSIASASYDRVPPHNLNAEVSVLGSMLLSRNAVADVSEIVGPEDFYRGAHRTMFEAARDLYNRGEPLDTVTLADELDRRGALDDVGGVVALTDIVQQVPTAANALYYARIVADQSLRRRLIDAGTEVTRLGYHPESGVDEALDAAEQVIFDVAQRGRTGDIQPIKPLLHTSFELLERLSENKTGITGLPTGFTDFDDLTAGLQAGNLVIVAARPAMGKSTLVTNMAAHVTVESRLPVALFSLEMSSDELVMRLLSAESRVNLEKLRTGRLDDPDWAKLSQAMGRLAEAPLFIDDTAGINLMEIRSKCRRLKQKHGLSLVVVDYLQLMQSHRRVENRVQEVSELSRGLKVLAKELSVPVIALSQLSRKPEDRARDDRRPQLADLRESGCVTGDTLVTLESGALAPIRDLVGTQPAVAVLDGWDITVARASKVWLTGHKPVFRLTTRTGRTVRATANHPLRTLDGWRPLGTLVAGDRIAIPRELPEGQHNPEWTPERLTLLAHLIGDGCYAPRQPLHYTSASLANIEAVEHAAAVAFGVAGRRVAQKTWNHLYLSAGANRWHPNPIHTWLRELGIDGQRSKEKEIPAVVLGLHSTQVRLFLRHLWATDGCIHMKAEGRKGPVGRIYYGTSSPTLARQVQHLLTRIGVLSRIKSITKPGYDPNFHVIVSGKQDQQRFLSLVGGHGEKGVVAEALLDALAKTAANTNVDTLPREVWTTVRARMQQRGISTRDMAALRGTSYGGTAHYRFAPSRDTLAEYADLLDSPDLKELAGAEIVWDTIVSIEPAGTEDVYDMTVPGPHSFIGDGICLHNSIEQDADLVAFIYRDEVYDPDTAAKGEAELIVAKHRNGPLRTIRLSFLGHHSRFANMARGHVSSGSGPL